VTVGARGLQLGQIEGVTYADFYLVASRKNSLSADFYLASGQNLGAKSKAAVILVGWPTAGSGSITSTQVRQTRMNSASRVLRRVATAVAALAVLPGLALLSAARSEAAEGCYLQDLLDIGGLLVVPEGCHEAGPLLVKRDAELVGGPVTVDRGIEVESGALLRLADQSTVISQIRVKAGAALSVEADAVTVDGTVWVEAGGGATLKGNGQSGLRVGWLFNEGRAELGGLVNIGSASQPISPGAMNADNNLTLTAIAKGSTVYFSTPTTMSHVGLIGPGGIGIPAADFVRCASETCVAAVQQSGGVAWLELRRLGVEGGDGIDPPVLSFDLAAAVAGADSGATIVVPADYLLTSSLVIEQADGSPASVTLTGGPIRRGLAETMILVPGGAKLDLRYIVVDGSTGQGRTNAYAPIVEVAAGGALAVSDGAELIGNASHGVVNWGELVVNGNGARIAANQLFAAALPSSTGPLGGAGVLNHSGAVFWLINGAVDGNRVVAGSLITAYGGGVLNAGAMRMAGGEISNNAVDGIGGGVAVIREPGAEAGGTFDFGAYSSFYPALTEPVISGNTATSGGAIAVVDSPQWGGYTATVAAARAPDGVSAAWLADGLITGNQSTQVGGATVAYGGSALDLAGEVVFEDSNQSDSYVGGGIGVADSYLRVSGDVVTEAGAGVALLKRGWPLRLADGFTGAGSLVVERIDSIKTWADPIQAEAGFQPTAAALEAIEVRYLGSVVPLELTASGIALDLSQNAEAPPGGIDPPDGPDPVIRPTAQATAPSLGPDGSSPTATNEPEAKSPSSEESEDKDGVAGSQGEQTQTDPSADPSPTASPSSSPEESTGPSASAGAQVDPSASPTPILSAPEPPANDSMRVLGFALMAIGVLGLLGVGVFTMRRAGFFVN
jgi:hypothetical protein